MKAAPIVLAAALLLPGAPAGAQTASDVRCLILSNVFAQKAAEPDVQKVAQASFYFYLGRVAAVRPVAELDIQVVVDLMTAGASTRFKEQGDGRT